MDKLEIFSKKVNRVIVFESDGLGSIVAMDNVQSEAWVNEGWNNTRDGWLNQGWNNYGGDHWENEGWNNTRSGWVNEGWNNYGGDHWENQGWTNSSGK